MIEARIPSLGAVILGLLVAACSATDETDPVAATAATEPTAEATNGTLKAMLDGPRPPSYEAPLVLPMINGELIHSEPIQGKLLRSGPLLSATQILYRSTSRKGAPIAVSGTVLVPTAPWVGPGTRPVIAYAVGTQGIGDSCAPSRQFSEGFEYEGVFMSGLLARGYALAITDYEGLGTVGMHTYMDRVSQGHTVLDSVRAAKQLPGLGLDANTPVGIFGYSQGGGAAAAAAELAATYAPELLVKGTVAGAVPADMTVLPANLDGTLWAEFLWFAIAGISASYDYDVGPLLNAKGLAFFEKTSDDCVFNLGSAAFKKSSDFTASGESLAEIVKREPFRTMMDDQRIGRIKPSAPVLVTHSKLDDTIPFKVGQQLAADWCALGATVKFSPNYTPLHIGGMLNNAVEFYGFFADRFAGRAAPSTCSN